MSLTTDLQDHIKDRLLLWESEREKIKDLTIDWLNFGAGPADSGANPPPAPYSALTNAVARLTVVHKLIATALDAPNSKVYRWVSPRLAAVAFEGVFESCVALWLAAGPRKDDPTKLRPAVARFIDWQVRMFAAAIEDK